MIVSDVGSVKSCVFKDLGPHLPPGAHLVPGHPIAGTEHSGPEAGFAELFDPTSVDEIARALDTTARVAAQRTRESGAAAARIAAFGSTATTRTPRAASRRAKMPVPAATSAASSSAGGASPASTASTAAAG